MWGYHEYCEGVQYHGGYHEYHGGIQYRGGISCISAFYGLHHYNLLDTGSFLIRKLNQSTSCLMLQFKGKNTLKLPSDSNFK